MNASELIDVHLAQFTDWRGDRLRMFRALIHELVPDIVEEFKWGTGMFSFNGKLLFGFGAFKQHVKFNFLNGASLTDPHKLFNNGFEAKTARSIDVIESDFVDEAYLRELVMEAATVAAG